MSMLNSRSSFLQIAPQATRATVSRALARSRISRASVRSYLSEPARSGVTRTRPGHLAPAALGIGRRVGLGGHDILPVFPVAVPDEHGDGGAERFAARTPASHSMRSDSIFMRAPRP